MPREKRDLRPVSGRSRKSIYIYRYIYYNLVTEMQAVEAIMHSAVAIISVSRSIYNKLSFHCHVIFPKIKVLIH